MHEVTFDGVTIGETKDTTGNYVVTGTKKGLLIIRGKSPLIEKTKTNFIIYSGDNRTYCGCNNTEFNYIKFNNYRNVY